MIGHIVLLKIKDSATPEELDTLDKGIRSLQSIPGVISVNCGSTTDKFYEGYLPRSAGYTFCLVVVLENDNALEVYDKSEFHTHIKNTCIFPILDKSKGEPICAVDIHNYNISPTS